MHKVCMKVCKLYRANLSLPSVLVTSPTISVKIAIREVPRILRTRL